MDGIRARACRAAGTLSSLALLLALAMSAAADDPPSSPLPSRERTDRAGDPVEGAPNEGSSESTPPNHADARLARLIRELGSPDYARRQQADEQLVKLGHAGREQLEAALKNEDVEVRLRAARLLERLKLDDLFAPSLVECQSAGQPASKALAALATQSGNHIHIGDPYGKFEEQTLQVNYGPICYWEAVDDICERTGNRVRAHYDMHTPGIVVSAGTPPLYPRAYSGPVRAQITGARRVFIEELHYEEGKAELNHSFQINLQFTWEDRFHIVGYATQPELVEVVTDNHVIGSAAQPSGGSWNATSRGLRQVTASIKLNPVPVSAQRFDVFKIRWGLIAAGDPAVLEIAELAPERTFAQHDLAVKIESIEKQLPSKHTLTLSVTRDLAMPDPQEVVFQEYEVELFDAEGRAFRLQSQQPSLTDRGVQLKLTFTGEAADSEPKTLKLHYPRLRARRDLELTFRNVPLPVAKPE